MDPVPLDWTAIILALIAMVNAAVASVAAVFAIKAQRQSKEIHLEVNSRMSQLLDLTKESAHAMGVEDERARGKGEDR